MGRLSWFAAIAIFARLLVIDSCFGGEAKIEKLGFISEPFVDQAGEERNFLVYLPYDYELGEQRPLLLYLHGMGESGDDPFITIHNNFGAQVWEMKRSFPFVCAIPQCREGEPWTGNNLQRAIDFTNHVEKKYGTDPERCYLTGVSSGGQGAWNAIQEYPDRFAAAAILCGTPPSNVSKVVDSKMPIWNFCNSGDAKDLVAANRQTWRDLIEAGTSPLVTEYPMTGHNCWDRVYRSPAMYEWLLRHRRSDKANESTSFHAIAPDKLIAEWSVGSTVGWTIDGAQLIANSTNEQPPLLVCPSATGEFELHVNAYIELPSSICRFGVTARAEESNQVLPLEIVLFDSSYGDCGVKSAEGNVLATISPLIQRQLVFGGMNDIRMKVTGRRLQVQLNSCPAIEMELPEGLWQRDEPLRPVLVGTEGVRWQYVRMRGSEAESNVQ